MGNKQRKKANKKWKNHINILINKSSDNYDVEIRTYHLDKVAADESKLLSVG